METGNEFQNDSFIGERDFDNSGSKTRSIGYANVIIRSFINSWLQRLSTAREAMYEILPGGSH